MIEPITVIWVGCGAIAGIMLFSMMRRRQLHLIELLKSYVDLQSSWTRRRERVAALAAENEKKAKMKAQNVEPSHIGKTTSVTERHQDVAA